MPKITPFLWFDDNAEEAMEFYTVDVVELGFDATTPNSRLVVNVLM